MIGDIHVGDQASFWFGSVVRGDMFYIRIGDHTNVQDNCVLHTRYCVVCASDNVSSISRAISTRLLNRRIELEAGRFYSLGNLDGCLTFSIVLSGWHGLQTLLIERLPTTRALAISTILNSAQGFVNLFDDL